MCNRCKRSEDGYVLWDYTNDTCFVYYAKPSAYWREFLQDEIQGPLELDIPYV